MNFFTRWSTILLLCTILPGITAAQERDKTHIDFSFIGGGVQVEIFEGRLGSDHRSSIVSPQPRPSRFRVFSR